MNSRETAALLLVGIGFGYYLPGLPAPLGVLNAYIGLVLVIAGVVLMLKAR